MLTSKHDLFAMAERHEPLYLMACNQKGYLTDAELTKNSKGDAEH